MGEALITRRGGSGLQNIGDIKLSVREDFGDYWLPCDGSLINNSDYPDLFEVIGGNGACTTITSDNGVVLTNIVYGNGYMVAYTKGGACTCYVADDISKGWTPVTLISGDYYKYFTICYDDGQWVAFAAYVDSSINQDDYVCIWTATNPKDGWTRQTNMTLDDNTTYDRWWSFAYKNGIYLALGNWSYDGSPYTRSYATKTPTKNSKWVQKDFGTGAFAGRGYVTYSNNQWVVVCPYRESNQGLMIQSISDPTNTSVSWEVHDTDDSDNNPYSQNYMITYFNERWVLASGSAIYTSEALNSFTRMPSKSLNDVVTDLVVNGDKIYCVSGKCLYYTTSPSGTWTQLSPTSDNWYSGVAFDSNNNMTIVGTKSSKPYFYTEAARKLPNIDADTAHAYIRAK